MVIEIHPGAFRLSGYFALTEQRALVARCRELGARPGGFYVPTVRGGAKMRIQMMCLGRHWNARTYQYEPVRSDHDGLPVQELPVDLAMLAKRVAADVAMSIEPDICIVNYYPVSGKLGIHQDKDERPETLAAGIPVVSVSVGDSAKFLIGGTHRRDRVTAITLASGDALVMGGPSRLRYHGVAEILPGTAPPELGLEGRFNLTFRQY